MDEITRWLIDVAIAVIGLIVGFVGGATYQKNINVKVKGKQAQAAARDIINNGYNR